MNKASFLTLVRQASRISDQDVEELEKLVVNFPYCQTAHLLIAKAAYDKGSMLSNQKLKKAAIYAANRQLLKKLIYTSDATVSLQPLENTETVAETPEKVISTEIGTPVAPALPELEILEEVETHEVVLDADITGTENPAKPTEIIKPDAEENSAEQEWEIETGEKLLAETVSILARAEETLAELMSAEAMYEDAAIAEEILEEGRLPESEAEFLGALAEEDTFVPGYKSSPEAELIQETEPEKTLAFEAEKLPEATEDISEIFKAESENQVDVSETVDETDKEATESENEVVLEKGTSERIISEEKPAETVAESEEKVQEMVAEAAHTLEDVPDLHELFLENAPEIIHENAAPQAETEETPTQTESANFLNDELLHETLASFDQYLFKPEKEQETEEIIAPEEDLKVVYPENEIEQIYHNDALGYWMNSSRLGESLQVKNELTSSKPYDFYPELIWEYSKTHELRKEIKPAPSKLTKQLEIIDEFLKLTPRLKTMANSKVKPEAQEDLSSKSSKISKNLATESLANIMVQQGKIKKAIKIYEHLILKIPEKKPYFVAQIEKLRNME